MKNEQGNDQEKNSRPYARLVYWDWKEQVPEKDLQEAIADVRKQGNVPADAEIVLWNINTGDDSYCLLITASAISKDEAQELATRMCEDDEETEEELIERSKNGPWYFSSNDLAYEFVRRMQDEPCDFALRQDKETDMWVLTRLDRK
jgi:hypothetical protein